MISIKQMIRTGAATLCAVCLLSACSSTLDEALDGGNTAQALTNIQIGDFPAFGSEANNGTQTRSAAIGTYDEGKTEWEDGDEILLKITDSKSVVTTTTLVYNGTSWAPKEGTLTLLYEGKTSVNAYYAPAYEWKNNELALKTDKSAGTEEYLTYTATQDLTKGLTIEFANRTYSRLRVAAEANSTITLTAADFTPAGTAAASGESTLTTTADAKGNAYFYGTWAASSSASVKSDVKTTYGEYKNDFTLPEAYAAKSYAVAVPKWMVIDTSCYYQWDAVDCITGTNNSFNDITSGSATNSCKGAPSFEDIKKYLGAGVYWDAGTNNDDGHQQTYIVNGEEKHSGLWMMKMDRIKNDVTPVNQVDQSTNSSLYNTGRPEDIANYFFLPATGYYDGDSYKITASYYWSSTLDNSRVYYLRFKEGYVATGSISSRNLGMLPMVKE